MTAGAYYKAVKPDGTDFRTGLVQWAPPDGHEGEWIVRHPTAKRKGKTAASYLSVATTPTDCTGMRLVLNRGKVQLPRLLLVEHIGRGRLGTDLNRPNKRTGLAFRYVDELDGMLTLGPQAKQIVSLIECAASRPTTIETEARRMIAARARDDAWPAAEAAHEAAKTAGRVAAWVAAQDAAWSAAWAWVSHKGGTTWGAAWEQLGLGPLLPALRQAAWGAAGALVGRDLLAQKHYDTLTRVWREAIGPIHPDDPALEPSQ